MKLRFSDNITYRMFPFEIYIKNIQNLSTMTPVWKLFAHRKLLLTCLGVFVFLSQEMFGRKTCVKQHFSFFAFQFFQNVNIM